MSTELLVKARGATLSECGLYRYRLWRRLEGGQRRMLFVMLNPSTADALADDPTIRRCIGFAQREGCGWLDVVNLYGWRATEPRALRDAPDPIGPDNDTHLRAALTESPIVVCAWGADEGPVTGRARQVAALLASHGPFCLGRTAKGAPRHPLYLRSDAPLLPWGVSRG